MSNQVGDRIKSVREQRGMSVSELARRSNVSRGYLYMIEKGESNPTQEKLNLIADALDTTLTELLGEATVIPQSLADFARENNLSYADVEALSNFSYRGNKPETSQEWAKLYQAIEDLFDDENS